MNALDVQRAVSVSKEADKIQLYYNVYLYAMLFVSLISVATSIVSRKSFKDVGPEFRYIALHLLGTSLVVMTGFSLWQPVILVPLIGSYSVGILDWLGPSGSIFGLWMTLISMGHLGMTFALGFLLQSYQLKVINIRNQWLQRYSDLWWQDCLIWVVEYRPKYLEVFKLVHNLSWHSVVSLYSHTSHEAVRLTRDSRASSNSCRTSFNYSDRHQEQQHTDSRFVPCWIDTLFVGDALLSGGHHSNL